jgi:hypothetical protein
VLLEDRILFVLGQWTAKLTLAVLELRVQVLRELADDVIRLVGGQECPNVLEIAFGGSCPISFHVD